MATNGRDFTRQAEGYEKFPYRCTAGRLTIGIGHNLDAKGLPDDIIEELFQRDYTEAECDCKKWLGPAWVNISGVRQGVLIDMAFNLGLTSLKEFRKLRAALEAGDWIGAAREMLDSKWAEDDVPVRAMKLAKVMAAGAWE